MSRDACACVRTQRAPAASLLGARARAEVALRDWWRAARVINYLATKLLSLLLRANCQTLKVRASKQAGSDTVQRALCAKKRWINVALAR